MTTLTMTLDLANVEYYIECLDEISSVRGNAMDSGDPEWDRRIEDEIISEHERNPWAWCCVRVTAQIGPFMGTDYLGCCSYKSEEDFVNSDYYYQQMKDNAFAAMKEHIISVGFTISD